MKALNTTMALLCLTASIGVSTFFFAEDSSMTIVATLALVGTLLLMTAYFAYEAYLFWTSSTVITEGTVVRTEVIPPSVSPVSAMAPMGMAHGASTVTSVEVQEFPEEIFTYSGILIRQPGEKVRIRCYMRKGTLIHSELVV